MADDALSAWEPSGIRTPFAALVIASRGSGKSTLIRSLWGSTLHRRFDLVACFCPTDFNDEYAETFPGSLFFTELHPEVAERLLDVQAERARAGQRRPRILVVIDDLSSDNEKGNKSLQKLYTRGRHYDISVIYSTQATQLTSTVWRTNSDYVFIGRQMGARAREFVVEQFLIGAVDEDDLPAGTSEKRFLKRLVKDHTRNHEFVVLDFFQGNGDLSDTVFTYRAPALPQVA